MIKILKKDRLVKKRIKKLYICQNFIEFDQEKVIKTKFV